MGACEFAPLPLWIIFHLQFIPASPVCNRCPATFSMQVIQEENMFAPAFLAKARQQLAVATSLFAIIANVRTPLPAAAEDHEKHGGTATPIKHLIIIIGENRTFDHVFATYQPRSKDSVSNLISKGIINADGTPGPN